MIDFGQLIISEYGNEDDQVEDCNLLNNHMAERTKFIFPKKKKDEDHQLI